MTELMHRHSYSVKVRGRGCMWFAEGSGADEGFDVQIERTRQIGMVGVAGVVTGRRGQILLVHVHSREFECLEKISCARVHMCLCACCAHVHVNHSVNRYHSNKDGAFTPPHHSMFPCHKLYSNRK